MITITSKLDAIVWKFVDACFSGTDAKLAASELERDLERLQAAHWLEGDWLVDVMRETAV